MVNFNGATIEGQVARTSSRDKGQRMSVGSFFENFIPKATTGDEGVPGAMSFGPGNEMLPAFKEGQKAKIAYQAGQAAARAAERRADAKEARKVEVEERKTPRKGLPGRLGVGDFFATFKDALVGYSDFMTNQSLFGKLILGIPYTVYFSAKLVTLTALRAIGNGLKGNCLVGFIFGGAEPFKTERTERDQWSAIKFK